MIVITSERFEIKLLQWLATAGAAAVVVVFLCF